MFSSTVQRECSVWICVCRLSSLPCVRDSLGSLEGQRWTTEEDEEGHEEERGSVVSEGREHGDILAAHQRETRSEQRHRAANR